MEFENYTVIVTGGTRGIGKGICQEFLKAGARVIATYAGNDVAAEMFKDQMSLYGDKLDLYKFDVTSETEIQNFFQAIDEKYSSVEVLINNSGIKKDNMAAMMPSDDWRRVLDVNLTGSYLMSKHVIPRFMSKKFGRIINMSSIGGQLGLPGQSNYAASKAGQIAMTKSLSKELAKKKITVNCVCPGFIDTEMTQDMPEEQLKEYKKTIPARRFGTTQEVAHAVMFLASDKASYITGSTIDITGGL